METENTYQLAEAFLKAEVRYHLWNSNKRTLVSRVLSALAKQNDNLKLSVEINTDSEKEFVRIFLFAAQAVNSKTDFRRGGSLTYFLKYNGMVLPVITYPFVDNQVYQLDPIVIGNQSVEPEALTKETIWHHFDVFIKTIYEWEVGVTQPIGFKIVGVNTMITDERNLPPKRPFEKV